MEIFTSTRLSFHPIEESHRDFLRLYHTDPDRTRYIPIGRPYTEEEIDAYMQQRLSHWQTHHFGTCVLYLRATGEPIGYAGLEYCNGTPHVDIRYGLLQPWWGQGLAYEAATRYLQAGFELWHLPVIYGAVVPANLASAAVLKKLGMTPAPDVDHFYGDKVDYYACYQRD